MQPLSAESVPSRRWTALQVQKELAAEIERTQALLQDRKRVALTSPDAVRMKKGLKTEGASSGGKGATKKVRK